MKYRDADRIRYIHTKQVMGKEFMSDSNQVFVTAQP
jgi:hypothetical protein